MTRVALRFDVTEYRLTNIVLSTMCDFWELGSDMSKFHAKH